MRKITFLLILLLFLNLLIPKTYAFSIGEIYFHKSSEDKYLLGFNIKNFPLQETLLALKRQREEILMLCEIEVFRKRPLFKDERLEKFLFFKKAGYQRESNQYYLEDEKIKIYFNHPEDLVNFLVKFEALPLSIPKSKNEKHYYLLIKVNLKFYTHLDSNLRYTSKVKEILYKTEKIYDLSEKHF